MQQQIKAVAFDAFGTLVEIHDKRRPFARIARQATRRPDISPMCHPVTLEQMAELCGADIDAGTMAAWQADLQAELAATRPWPEAIDVLAELKRQGLRTAVASNLALPYAAPIHEQLGAYLDVSCLSFEVGFVKPDAGFYAALCERLQLAPQQILMIGDTWRCDYAGAREAGLQAIHLDRRGNATPEQAPVATPDLRGVLKYLDGERPG